MTVNWGLLPAEKKIAKQIKENKGNTESQSWRIRSTGHKPWSQDETAEKNEINEGQEYFQAFLE